MSSAEEFRRQLAAEREYSKGLTGQLAEARALNQELTSKVIALEAHVEEKLSFSNTLEAPLREALLEFFRAVVKKLEDSERKHGWSGLWADPAQIPVLQSELVRQVGKGDVRDVAAYCAFLYYHKTPCALFNPFTPTHRAYHLGGDVELLRKQVHRYINREWLKDSVVFRFSLDDHYVCTEKQFGEFFFKI